jgi:hypothetical protein
LIQCAPGCLKDISGVTLFSSLPRYRSNPFLTVLANK